MKTSQIVESLKLEK